jgi:hypothetical protein
MEEPIDSSSLMVDVPVSGGGGPDAAAVGGVGGVVVPSLGFGGTDDSSYLPSVDELNQSALGGADPFMQMQPLEGLPPALSLDALPDGLGLDDLPPE